MRISAVEKRLQGLREGFPACAENRVCYTKPRVRLLRLFPYFSTKILALLADHARKVFVLMVIQAAAFAQAQTVTLDFPYKPQDLPAGLADFPRESFQGLAAIEIPLLSLEKDGSVLVSVVFQDDEERIIQAKWIANETETILAANLSEGVRAWNRRAFTIPGALLRQPGSFVLETDAETQPVRRVNLTWMWPGGVYMASGAHAVEYVADVKSVLTAKDLADSKSAPVPDSWANGIWKASLQEERESLEDGLQFEVPVRVPRAAIFRAKVLGFPMTATPAISANGEALSGVSMEMPALASPGYFKGESGEIGFAGWREVAVLIPPGLLQSGVNAISLEAREGAYIKDAQLELSFEDEGAPLDLFESPSPVGEEPPVAQFPFENILPGLDDPLNPNARAPVPFP